MGEPSRYQENPYRNVILGALAGGGMALGVCEFFWSEPNLVTVIAVLVAASLCGTLGFFYGESFVTWLREDLGWF